MPVLGTRGGLSARGFGFAVNQGPAAGPYWLGMSPTATSALVGSASDAQGNFISCGSFYNGTTYEAYVVKFTPAGAIMWQRRLANASFTSSASAATVDTQNNVYIVGQSGASSFTYGVLAKYNAAGVLQWQRSLSAGTTDISLRDVRSDSSNNVYVAGAATSTARGDVVVVAKYNSAGVLQWQRLYATSASGVSYMYLGGLGVGGAGDVYVSTSSAVGSSYAGQLVKYDTSGTLQWQTGYYDASGNVSFGGGGVVVTASGIVGVAGTGSAVGPANQYFMLLRYTSAGVLSGGAAIGNAFLFDIPSVAADPSSNFYVAAQLGVSGSTQELAKFSPSGALIWKRSLDNTLSSHDVSVDAAGNIKWAMQFNGSGGATSMFAARLPGDGSKTGTYTVNGSAFTYAVSTFNSSAYTPPSITPTSTSATSAYTDAAGVLIDSTASLTLSVTTI